MATTAIPALPAIEPLDSGLPRGLQRECDGSVKDRNFELCAQWAAADAAKEASTYTLWAIGLSFLGTLIIALTFAETRMVSRRELRAYLRSKPHAVYFDAGGRLQVHFQVLNDGSTPAHRCRQRGGITFGNPEIAAEAAKTPFSEELIHFTLHPNQTDRFAYIHTDDPIPPGNMAIIKSGNIRVFAFGTLLYDDVFGRSHFTKFSYEILGIGQGEISWNLTSFHNVSD